MPIIIRPGIFPREQAIRENAIAATQRNADIIEYIAMMTDVEIPTDSAEAIYDEQ